MNFTSDKEELLNAVQVVQRAVSLKNPLLKPEHQGLQL